MNHDLRDHMATMIAASIIASANTRTDTAWQRIRSWFDSGYAVNYCTPKYRQVAEVAYAQADVLLAVREETQIAL